MPEMRDPGDVLQRLARGAPVHRLPEPRVERVVGNRVQLAAAHPVYVRGDQLGVGSRRVDLRLGQLGGGAPDLIEQQVHPARSCPPTSPLVRSVMSAWVSALITPSRSPSRTWSRL